MSVTGGSGLLGMGTMGGSRGKPVTPTLPPGTGVAVGRMQGGVGIGTPSTAVPGQLPTLGGQTPTGLSPYGGGGMVGKPGGAGLSFPGAMPSRTNVFGADPSAPTFYSDPSNVFPSAPYTPAGDLFMSQNLRSKFQQAPVSTTRNTTVASSKFHHYTAIVNIDPKAVESTLHRSLVTQVLRTTNRFNGKHVVLRRVVSAPATPADCSQIYEKYRHFRHPNLVPLHSITPTTEFVLGSNDTIMEYRMVKRGKSMADAFFTGKGLFPQATTMVPGVGQLGVVAGLSVPPPATVAGAVAGVANGAATASSIEGPQLPCEVTEGLLWSIACQLIGLIRTFHDVGVPLRGLHLSKLMWLDVCGRIYFTGLGLMDVADPNPAASTEMLFKYDVQQLGLILLQLATLSPNITVADGRALMQRSHRYSNTFLNLVAVCLDASVDVNSLCRGLGERLANEVGHQEGNVDFLLTECSKEVHNGRLMRLMVKLMFVIESHDAAAEYAEASDRYTLKLFSQYVFAQVDEQNRPRIDFGHVYHSLNKLDCSSEDLVQLISQDSSTILVVSFRDIRIMLDKIFEQLQAPGHELSYAGLSAMQQQAPTATPPTIHPPA